MERLKRIAAPVLIAGLAAGAVFLIFYLSTRRPMKQKEGIAVFPSAPAGETERAPSRGGAEARIANLDDSDRDGAADWEEILRGTDPQRPDRAPQPTEERVVDISGIIPRPERAAEAPASAGGRTAPPEGGTGREEPPPAQPEPQRAERAPAPFPSAETVALRAYAGSAGTTIQLYASRWQTEVSAFEAFMSPTTVENPQEAAEGLRGIANDYRARADALTRIAPPAPAAALHAELIERYRAQAAAIDLLASRGEFGKVPAEDWNSYGAAVVAAGQAYYQLAQFLSGQNAALFGAPF